MKISFLLLMVFPWVLLSSCAAWHEIFNPDEPPPAPPSATASEASQGPKKRILVLKFLNKTPLGADLLSNEVDALVRSAVQKCPECVVVSENELDGHENFSENAAYYNYKTIFQKARAYGISAVVLGTIDDLTIEEKGDEIGIFRTRFYTARAIIKFRLYDAATERELVTKVLTGMVNEERTRFPGERAPGSEDAERGKLAIAKALEPVLAQFPEYSHKIAWEGRIAKIDLHRYYINAGEETGITLGQLLKVFGDGAPVTDAQTGTVLGMAPGRFKGLLKVVDYLGKDGAVAVLHSGGGFREQDHVEVYSPPQR